MKPLKRLLILSCLSLSCALVSCDKEEQNINDALPKVECGESLLSFNSVTFDTLFTDSASVRDITLEQSCLIAEFAYSGCDYREMNVMAFLDQSAPTTFLRAKIQTTPPDACLAYYTHIDTFDLSTGDFDLYDGLTLNVHGWDESFVLDLN